MKSLAIAAALLAAGILLPQGSAEARGCIKGAVVGGVAGHVVHHGWLGAAAGCVIGHHEANKHAREQTQGSGSSSGNQRY